MDRLEPPPFKASRHRLILLPLSYDKRLAVSSSRAFWTVSGPLSTTPVPLLRRRPVE